MSFSIGQKEILYRQKLLTEGYAHTRFIERLYDKGFYVTECDVIQAMKECGYQAVQRDGQTYFNVSNQSRALQIFYASLGPPTKDCKFEWN